MGDRAANFAGIADRHAEVVVRDDHLYLTHLSSRAVTRIRGLQVAAHEPVQLSDGDEVVFGEDLRARILSGLDPQGHIPQRGEDPAPRGLLSLPSALRVDYRLIRELPARGSEAGLLLAQRSADQLPVVVKVYFNASLNPDTLRQLQQVHPDHIVTIHDFGMSDGRWYEVLEHVEGGDLAGIGPLDGSPVAGDLLLKVVKEMAIALDALHSRGLAHQDVKPSNVLLRTREPLDLVLADFGFATVTDATIIVGAGSNRTPRYAAPEVLGGVGGRPRDLWSLGVIIWELLVGRPAFRDLSEAAITAALVSEPWPLDPDVVEDERWRDLCTGLLIRDPERRWSVQEVLSWLDGDTPPVPSLSWSSAESARTGYQFLRTNYASVPALGRALASEWNAATERISEDRDEHDIDDWLLDREDLGHDLRNYLHSWRDGPWDVHGRLLRLVLHMDPALPPVYRGYDVSMDGMRDLAAAALGGSGGTGPLEAIDSLYAQHALDAIGELRDPAPHAELADAWRDQVEGFSRHVASATANGATPAPDLEAAARARILLALVDGSVAEELARIARRHARRVDGPDWYGAIADGASSIADHLALSVFADEAARLQHDEESAERDRIISQRRYGGGATGWAARHVRLPVALLAASSALILPLVSVLALAVVAAASRWSARIRSSWRRHTRNTEDGRAALILRLVPAVIRGVLRAIGDIVLALLVAGAALGASWMAASALSQTVSGIGSTVTVFQRIAPAVTVFASVWLALGTFSSPNRIPAFDRIGNATRTAPPLALAGIWIAALILTPYVWSQQPGRIDWIPLDHPRQLTDFANNLIPDVGTRERSGRSGPAATAPQGCWTTDLAPMSSSDARTLWQAGYPVGIMGQGSMAYLAHPDQRLLATHAATLADADPPRRLARCDERLEGLLGPARLDGSSLHVIGAADLHVREGPGQDFDSITTIEPGPTYPGTGRARYVGGTLWREIELPDGTRGWSSAKYLVPVSS